MFDGARSRQRAGSLAERRAGIGRATQERRSAARHTYGAVDLGTNNCRLLIARPVDNGFTVIDAFSRIVRLGEGLSSSGRLSDEAMGRAVAALSVCAEKASPPQRIAGAFGRDRGVPAG